MRVTFFTIFFSIFFLLIKAQDLDRSLYEDDILAYKIELGSKNYGSVSDRVFKDGLGREVHLRGWNVSGAVKLKATGFKPFLDSVDANTSFEKIRTQVGSNLVRFTIAWEGVHPAVDSIDYAYLDAIIAQMKAAIHRNIYLVVDYHSDLYSRYLFNETSAATGNGAPKWIIDGGKYPREFCLCLHWSQNKLNNEAIRKGIRDFFKNATIKTAKGDRNVQDEFIYQVGQTAKYIKEKLTPEEFIHILGIEPINEPFDGGFSGAGLSALSFPKWTPSRFDNELLWPFYERVRSELDKHSVGWSDKLVFAEPLVFWNSNLPFFAAPATGKGYLRNIPKDGFVFTPHSYDQARQGGVDLTVPRNGAYFKRGEDYVDEARYLNMPVFISEFGQTVGGEGHNDNALMMNASIQMMESSNRSSVEKTGLIPDGGLALIREKRSRRLDFYHPIMTWTQWHWNFYYNNITELQNGNPARVINTNDAWNGENFSVVKNFDNDYTNNNLLYERAYPRRSQGDIMNFFYNSTAPDAWGGAMNWGVLRLAHPYKFKKKDFFYGKKFALLVWKGRNSNAPTEIYIPQHFNVENTLVITDKQIYANGVLTINDGPYESPNEVIVRTDANRLQLGEISFPEEELHSKNGLGYRYFIWDDDTDCDEDKSSYHYALIVNDNEITDNVILKDIQSALSSMINQEINPVYMSDRTIHDGEGAADYITNIWYEDFKAYNDWKPSGGKEADKEVLASISGPDNGVTNEPYTFTGNISGDVKWILPPCDVKIFAQTDNSTTVSFASNGTYDIVIYTENEDGHFNYAIKKIVIGNSKSSSVKKRIAIGPNPAIDSNFILELDFYGSLNDNDVTSIQLYDANGYLLESRTVLGNKNREIYNLRGSHDNYYIIVITNRLSTTSKIILNKK